MSTVIRSGRNALIDALRGASGSGGKCPGKGNGGRRPPRDRPVIGKARQVDACALCKRIDHKTDKCPHRAAFLDWSVPAFEAPAQEALPPSERRNAYQTQFPLARVTVGMRTGLSPPRLRAALAKRAPEREEPREDIEEEPQERLQQEREQIGALG
ncbi:hypothetical protein CNMCM5793_001626 [Aspergillus hiratsukae]|uniref:Uncharacterized protein n=1 Tax=Aspergillus hiratsukae TaxID=1194566 RepID=A0A8H6UW69_9EURO|nr:hypothetical protein CNMCM5793_001626 [Aspergillus hiratsukae]KAF7165155.1 hypothetical protein CNMCM6106_001395 [Aspergillus hiratsukae]